MRTTTQTITTALLAALLLAACSALADDADDDDGVWITPPPPPQFADGLPALNIKRNRVTVSGLSSGAYMAQQLHTIHSDRFSAAAILAGGPFYCAENSIGVALTRCMKPSGALDADIDRLVRITRDFAARGDIADTDGLADDPVFIFSSPTDSVVQQAVSDGLERWYQAFTAPANITYVNDFAAAHAMPTDDFGYPCDHEGASSNPDDHFINNCGYDLAGEVLKHAYRRTKAPKANHQLGGRFVVYDQSTFIPEPQLHGMAADGWAYIPAACDQGKKCKLHVVLHGCLQSAERIGDTYVKHAGYNDWADRNRIVLLYPQATASLHEGNGNGCWDWWGYDDADYASRHGRQVQAVMGMVDRLVEGDDGAPEPDSPTGLRVLAQLASAVTLGWDHSPYVTGYTLYHSRVDGGPYLQVGADVLLDTQANLTDLEPGTHWFVVVAVDASGVEGGPSQELSVSVPGV